MSLMPYRSKINKPDLSYRQIRAITTFQSIFKLKSRMVRELNRDLRIIYSTLVSVSNNINSNYINGIINPDHYRNLMLRTDELVSQYLSISKPLTLKSLSNDNSLRFRISYLHYQVTELVKICGASCCYDVFRIFAGEDWDLSLDPRHQRLLQLFNTMFVPVKVKSSTVNINEIKVLKSMFYTESLTLKIHGAEIILPLLGKSFTVRGYFRDDPLNTARIGGQLGEKLDNLKASADKLYSNEKILHRYLQQITLRDFLCLDESSLLNMIGNDLRELEKLKSKPKGHVLEEFLRASLKQQYHLLTLLLLDDESNDYTESIITTLSSQRNDTLNTLYRILHWSLQTKFDHLVKIGTKEIGVDESVLPYDARIEKMDCSESIKKKAIDKLKEIKSGKDNIDKPRRYLEGLLRIPFGQYRKEPIIRYKEDFVKLLDGLKYNIYDRSHNVEYDEDDTESAHEKIVIKRINDIFQTCQYNNEMEINNLLVELNSIPIMNIDNIELLQYARHELTSLTKSWSDFKLNRKNYLNQAKDTLKNCIYGQEEAKRNIESIIAQWINGEMTGVVFGFQGYPGTGKTTLAKQGIAKCLVDEHGNSRPFYFTSLGGANGSSFLLGHGYTYVGSQPGKLAEYVQDAKIMNPILYFDELDKVSNTPHGEEIIRVLTHLLDPEQNNHIEDRYFGVDMDLSKALIILSYNDSSVIDSILMDRIHEINFKQYNRNDKTVIARDYILPKILQSHGFSKGNIIISDELLGYIVETYTCEAGVRDMKDKLTDIIREINLRKIYNDNDYPLPYTVTKELIDNVLKSRNKIHIEEIPCKPQIGWVNGLYATNIGTGGITIIEAYYTPSDQKYSLELTGKLGEVMKESVTCAKTISWAMFKGTSLFEKVNTDWKENALHVHFPAAGTSKDGPSAGAAITSVIISYFSRMPFRNYIAMTGEIDLHGRVCPIGGLQCKIEGAQRAGVKIVLIPRKNEEQYLEFKDNYDVKVFPVDNISQVIRTCLVGAEDNTFNYLHDIKDDPVINDILLAIKSIES